jgi:vacuolar-type H+-ATPase subunit H
MADKKLNSLAQAEQRANEIVKKAVERKSKLLDEAGVAADREIGFVRERLQKEFEAKKYDTTEEEKKQAEITSKDIAEVYKMYEAQAEACVDYMLDRVTKVDHTVSRNIKADFSNL